MFLCDSLCDYLILKSVTDAQRKKITWIYHKQKIMSFFQTNTNPDIFHFSRQANGKKGTIGIDDFFVAISMMPSIDGSIKIAYHIFFVREAWRISERKIQKIGKMNVETDTRRNVKLVHIVMFSVARKAVISYVSCHKEIGAYGFPR